MADRFSILADSFTWINGSRDDPDDLCAHAHVTVQVGGEDLAYTCCASAAALRMLKTLTEPHRIEPGDTQMLPCCGHFMVADKTLENVWISGCPYGVDYQVEPSEECIHITTESGHSYSVHRKDYVNEIVQFAEQVETFYQNSTPKHLPTDDFERNGYIAFWNEWRRRMAQAKAEQA